MSNAIQRRLIASISAHPYMWACTILLLWTLLLETGLLHKKYDLFSGGFLQPFAYTAWGDRAAFLLFSAISDIGLILAASEIWRQAALLRIDRSATLVWYNFFSAGMIAISLWIFSKYQLLSYFNDTINFTIIANLGGGSLVEAISYVSNEITIVLFVIFGFALIYWLGLRAMRKIAPHGVRLSRRGVKPTVQRLLLVVVLVVPVTIATNTMPWLEYGMSKLTSFSLIESALNILTDFDIDGYGISGRTRDPALFDSSIYPFALDVPGNGIDEDGYAGDLPPRTTMPRDGLAEIRPRHGKHIVLIVLESARADLIGKQLDGKPVAPHITRLAQTGWSAPYAYSHTGFTTSSLKALLNRSLSDKILRLRLVDFLKSCGYQLSFLSGQDESFGDVAASVGMSDPGVYLFDARSALEDRVYPSKAAGSLRLSEERIIQALQERLQVIDWRQPQFIYINFQAAHFPYDHPKMRRSLVKQAIPRAQISASNQKWLADTYWNAIASADWATGETISILQKAGVWEQTTLGLLGDHGESLFDDKFLGHGHAINEIQTRIPFVLNQTGITLHQAIGQIDIAEIVVRVAFNEPLDKMNDNNERVFQFVGSLDRPQQIGEVTAGEQRTVLDLRNRTVSSLDRKYIGEFNAAMRDPHLHNRALNLVNDWATLRWDAAQSEKIKSTPTLQRDLKQALKPAQNQN